MEEIRANLWALKSLKAPSPDGLHAGFYQHFWMEVKNSICEEIKEVFTHGVVPSYLNETLIALLPKCQNPESLDNYRPISLCNSIYKVISKIIVARIRPHLSNLISPVQATFVPGRRGTNNVCIAQELLHTLDNKKKGRVGYMAIKLDLKKAYDRLEWNFEHRILEAFRFPPKLTKIIMSCILGCTNAAPRRAHPCSTRRDAATREGRRRPRVRAASCLGTNRRRRGPNRADSVRIGRYRPNRPKRPDLGRN